MKTVLIMWATALISTGASAKTLVFSGTDAIRTLLSSPEYATEVNSRRLGGVTNISVSETQIDAFLNRFDLDLVLKRTNSDGTYRVCLQKAVLKAEKVENAAGYITSVLKVDSIQTGGCADFTP